VARSYSCGDTSSKNANTVVIALLTHTSIGPRRSSIAAAAAWTWSNSATSAAWT
jgi:hypothetical protein